MLGALVVSLGLDAADFISGMSKSEQQAKKFASNLDRNIAVGVIKAEVALRALGAAAKTTFDIFQSLTVGAGEFKDLEETTGASAESLASLAVAGATAGVSMEAIGGAANKLTKSLVGVDDESKAAGAALTALGLSVKEFKALDPAAQYEAVGKALSGFADGASKVAVAQALFGKSGAEQLKVFKALEEQGGRQTILTQRQIELSDAYADAQAKAAAQLKLYAQAAASEAVPALTDLTTASVTLLKALLGIDEKTGALAANNAVADWARKSVDGIAALIDGLQKVDRFLINLNTGAAAAGEALRKAFTFDFKGASDAVDRQRAAVQARDAAPLFSDNLAKARRDAAVAASVAAANASPLDARDARARMGLPTLTFEGATGASKANAAASDAAREQRRILDGQLKEIRAFAEEQKDAFDFANRFVKASYDDGLATLAQTFESERQIRAAALQSTIASLDAEVRVLEEHARNAAKPEARIDAENKIAEAVAKRSQAVQRAQQDAVLSTLEEARAIEQLQARYDDLRATIAQLSGDTQAASGIRIAQQVAEASKILAQSGQDQGAADTLGALLTNTERLNRAQADYGALVERARLVEESILLTARESGATEIETLRAVGASRNAALQQMSKMVQEAQELAAVLGTDEARRYADNLAVAFQRARAEADPLLQKVREIGREAGDAIASGFEDAIVSGGNLREILKGIEQALVRIVTRNLVTKPLADYLTNVIGGNGQASGGGGLIGDVIGRRGGGNSQGTATSGLVDQLDGNFVAQFARLFGFGGRGTPALGGGSGSTGVAGAVAGIADGAFGAASTAATSALTALGASVTADTTAIAASTAAQTAASTTVAAFTSAIAAASTAIASFTASATAGTAGNSGSGIVSGIGSLLGSSSGSGSGDFAAAFLSTFGGFFEKGGDLPSGKWGIAGEAGPELIRGPANVIPTNRSMSMLDRMSKSRSEGRSTVLNTVFHLSGPTSLATQGQIEAKIARSVAAANARMN